jgi:ATPase subunit of ABC transporter with duplicated ATPase domains
MGPESAVESFRRVLVASHSEEFVDQVVQRSWHVSGKYT